MSFLTHMKRATFNSGERWIVKYNKEGLIREVKQVYNATEYRQIPNARPLLTQNKLIKALEEDKVKR